MLKTFISLLFINSLLIGCGHHEPENDAASLLKTADRLQEKGNIQSAIPIYQKALEKPGAAKLPIYLKLGQAYLADGDLEAGRKIFEQALTVDENNQANNQLARCYLLAGKPEAAIIIYQGIIEKNQNDFKAYNGLGVASDLKHNHKQAQEYYKKALQLHSGDSEITSNLALSLAFSGNFQEALKLMQPLGEQVGASTKQRHNLAVIYTLAQQDEKARDLFSKDLESSTVEQNIGTLKRASIKELSHEPVDIKPIIAEATINTKKEDPISELELIIAQAHTDSTSEFESEEPAELGLTATDVKTETLKGSDSDPSAEVEKD